MSLFIETMSTSSAVATPPPPYHVQSSLDNIQSFDHHQSVSALWHKKWRGLASMGIYPFVDGKVEDFDPIFAALETESGNSPSIFYEPDAYAKPFLPIGASLVEKAAAAEVTGDTDSARDLYLRAAAVYRIARFPIIRSSLSQKAWELGKDAYIRGGKYLDPPNMEVSIPHTHKDLSAGDKDAPIPAYLRIPKGEKPTQGWPIIILICGLDAYRTDHTPRTNAHTAAGFATLSLEIPGTGDCPASWNDPLSPDRLFSSVFEWLALPSTQSTYHLDASRITARGLSTGGYYAFRVAHTHADKLFAAVAQGGGSHWMYEASWIKAQNHMEYPFALADALAYKLGYGTLEAYIEAAERGEVIKRFSLLEGGILQQKSCRMLIINGMEDSIFPIEDSLLVASYGRVKDVRLMAERKHVGNPGAEEVVYEWISEVAG